MKKCTSLAIVCFVLLTVFSNLNRAQELVVRCCDRVNVCIETIEDADCGKDADGCSIPYTCERVHQYPICPNNGYINQTCNYGQPACEFPDEEEDE